MNNYKLLQLEPGKKLLIKHGRYNHAKQFKRKRATLKKLKVRLARVQWEGTFSADINQMTKFIEYLSNDLWVKIFNKPANETDFKVKDWFSSDRETLNNHVTFGKTSEGLSHPCP